MPAATTGGDAEVKSDREEILWQALKEHIMRERQKKKEGWTTDFTQCMKLQCEIFFFP